MRSWLVCLDEAACIRQGTDRSAARAIQQELIDDFASKPELSDWFSRVCGSITLGQERELIALQEEVAPPPVVKKPNPQNEKNKATLEELEEEVRRYVPESACSTFAPC